VGSTQIIHQLGYAEVYSNPNTLLIPFPSDFDALLRVPLPFAVMYLYILFIALLERAVRGQNSTSSNSTLLVDPDVYPGASQICLDALSYEPNCNPIVYALYGSYYTSIDLETLTDLCRGSCFTSLQAHQANVSSACEGIQYYDESSGSYYPPDFLDLQAISGFNVTCIQDA
jgi:hypothetical protein